MAQPVNLELRPLEQTVGINSPVDIGLFAVSKDPAGSHFIPTLQVIIQWDPDVLRLQGVDNTGGAPLLQSGFPSPDPHGLNEADPPQDGDAIYLALANLGTRSRRPRPER